MLMFRQKTAPRFGILLISFHCRPTARKVERKRKWHVFFGRDVIAEGKMLGLTFFCQRCFNQKTECYYDGCQNYRYARLPHGERVCSPYRRSNRYARRPYGFNWRFARCYGWFHVRVYWPPRFNCKRFRNGKDLRQARCPNGRHDGAWRVNCHGVSNGYDWRVIQGQSPFSL